MEKSIEYMNGWNAHRKGCDQALNPHNEALQSFSYRHWINGWCDRFNAVKRGWSLALDDKYE